MRKSVLVVGIILALLASAIPIPASAQVTVPQGPWVDEVVFSIETDQAKAVDMLEKGEMQAYYWAISDATLFKKVKASPNLWYALSYGSYNELTFNPVGPTFPATGELNPFSVPKIREAMNYMVDRKYISEELCGGLAVPRYTAVTPSFPDYARLIDTARKIEVAYSYSFDKGKTIITEEMKKLGAELKDGKWNYKGKPVTIKFLIRTEDERKAMGDYISTQLEKIGFTVERMYKTSAEASPLWSTGDPAEGKWSIYTGGWVTTVISRDQSGNFDYFYTPRGLPRPLWQAYKPDPEFDYIAETLAKSEYATMEERNQLMAKALELSMKDSVRVWLVNRVSPWAARKDVEVTCDLAGGFYGARTWPYTIRFKDKVGGTVKIASSNLLVEPWNPVGGSNWIFDQMIIRATHDLAYIADPYTGLLWPERTKKAEVYIERGLPVTKTLDWVSLKSVDEIAVPTDAWYGWNATGKKITTTPSGTKAKAKIVTYYEDGFFDTKYHDGTKMSLADFVFNFIMAFDRADPASPVYDEAYVPEFKTFRAVFKGFKIISEKPLVTEYYTDITTPDAEWMAADGTGLFAFGAPTPVYPVLDFGQSPWHMVALGWKAEAEKKIAFTSAKAKKLAVEQTSYIAGPTLPILKGTLDEALATGFRPYEEVLGKYVSVDEAKAKYAALKTWYEAKGHLWIGNGPFYVDRVDTTAKIVVIKAFREHPDKADKWAGFAEPKIPVVSVTGPSTIVQGMAADFVVKLTFKGQPYETKDMDFVKYLIVGPAGDVGAIGAATPVKDGEWKITLSAADTSILTAGSNKIEIVASSKRVSIPSFADTLFTSVPFKDYLSGELSKLRAELQTPISTLQTSTTALQKQASDLQASVSTLSTIATISLVLALIAIVIAVIPMVRKK